MTVGRGLVAGLVAGLGVLMVGTALVGQPARAAPLDRSPIPPFRAGLPDPPLPVAPIPVGHAPLRSVIPALRILTPPSALVLPVGSPTGSPAAPLTSLIPLARPGTLAAPRQVSDQNPNLTPAPDADRAPAPGALCGDPALSGQTMAPIRSTTQGCGLVNGVKITRIAGLGLSQPVVINCTTARSLSTWTQTVLLPAARNLNFGVAGLEVADSYVCRPRNNVPGSKISEHGRGAAIDIAGITLKGGDSVSVLDDWNRGRKGRLLATIRRAACGLFTTVVGPGSDRFHRNHLHFDTATGRGPYCH